MLSQVKFSNFKSFIKDTTIDIKRTNYKLLEQNTYNNILKGVSFFGGNASGKTNALTSVRFLLDLLFTDKDQNFILYHSFFTSKTKTKMEYTFVIDEKEIYYSFTFRGSEEIIEEIVEIDKKNIITRIGNNAKTYISDNEEEYVDVDKNILFLRKLYFNTKFSGNNILKKWFAFLQNSVYVNAYERRVISFNNLKLTLYPYLDESGENEFNKFFNDFNFGFNVSYSNNGQSGQYTFKDEENTLFFQRKEMSVSIPYMFESLGNQTLVNLLPAVLHVAKNGGMLLIDEFSSGFHNELEELIIKYFMNYSKNSQLFLVSHSTNILSNSLLRPDQLYAVDFLNTDGSVLKRFSDEQPRAAQNIEKMYLGGVFGGVPHYDFTKE